MASLDSLQPWLAALAAEFVALVRRYRPSATVTSAFRSSSRQAHLYARWQAGQSPYPAAPPGRSLHEYGLAFDLDIPGDPDALRAVGEAWESLGAGYRWGGSFSRPDVVHFEFLPSPDPRSARV